MLNYLIWLLLTAMYAPIFWQLYNTRWDKLDYTHAYFIFPISLWLAWRSRDRLKTALQNLSRNKQSLGFCIFVFGILLFVFSWRQNYYFLSTLSLIPVLFGITLYLYGYNVVKILSFPILYLLLLVPPPFGILDSITLPMRKVASIATEIILKSFHYPVSREGLFLNIGYNQISIGEPCSGFRSLITLLSLGLVYVYISKSTMLNKFLMTASIVPLAIFGNFIRIVALCLITFYFGEEVGQGFFHNFSGIVMFIITVIGLISIEGLLNKFVSNN